MKDLKASSLEGVGLLCNKFICNIKVLLYHWLPGGGGGAGGPGADGGGGAGGGGAAATGGGAAVASKISSNLAAPPSFSAVSIASHFLCSNSFCGRG